MRPDKRLWQAAKNAKVALWLTIGLGFSGGLILIGQAFLLSRVINRVFLEGAALLDVRGELLTLAGLALVRALFVWGSDVMAQRVAGQVKHDLRMALTEKLFALGPSYTKSERTGELTNTLTEGIEALEAYFSQYLPQLVLAALVPLTILLVVFPIDLLTGVVFLLTAPLIPLFMVLIGQMANARSQKQWKTLSRMSAFFLDVLQGLTTLKLLGQSKQQIKLIRKISGRFRETTMGVLRIAFLSALVLELLATLSVAVVAVEIGVRLLSGGMPFSEALFILVLAPEFYMPLRLLGARFHAGMSGVSAADRIFEVLGVGEVVNTDGENTDEEKEITNVISRSSEKSLSSGHEKGISSRRACPEPGRRVEMTGGVGIEIELRGVGLTYPHADVAALDGVSLSIAAGSRVALVGPSGAGKSSLAQLLLGFMQPSEGEILVNGVSLASIDVDVWREQVAWVAQRPFLFNTTILDNIHMAKPSATQDDVIAAAKQAQIHSFIETLPDGYETMIGEQGTRLSGGQAQRLALARAFLKDAPFLILDEATSNLDAVHEAALNTAVSTLITNRTVLTISHRLHTVADADVIIVLENGRIRQQGTHEELVQDEGLYQSLAQAYAGEGEGRYQRSGISGQPLAENSQQSTENGKRKTFPNPQSPIPNPIPRLLRMVAPFSWQMLLAILLGFATVGSSIGLMSTSGYIISKAALQPSIAEIQVAIVGVRFFGISRGVFRYLERLVSHDVTFKLLARLRVWFYKGIEPLAPARLLHMDSGDLLSRIVADIETLENFFIRVIAPPLVAMFTLALMMVFMGNVSWGLVTAVSISLLLAGLGVPLFTFWLSRGIGKQMVAVRSRLNVTLVDVVQGNADLLVLGQANAFQQRVAGLSTQLINLQQRMATISGLHGAVGGLLMHLATVVVLLLSIPLVTIGTLDGVMLAVLALATMASFEAVMPLPLAFQYLEESVVAANRLFELVDAIPAVQDPPIPSPTPIDNGITIDDLRFSYGAGQVVLDGIDFSVGENGRIAIVGPSGAGKSTLSNLLLRFFEFEQGEIRLGGHPLQAYQQDDVRNMISVVSQRTHLFNGTIRDNLLIARPKATEDELFAASQQAQIHDFIKSLPDGYETWIGEQGLRLSGGERQRLAIARAILKDTPILILDEATANLDAITEQKVLQALESLMANRTTLIITHRLTGLEAVDEILVLRNGRIIERGTHDALLQQSGLYRHMWNLQRG